MAIKARLDALEKELNRQRPQKRPIKHFLWIEPKESEPVEEIEKWKRDNPDGLVIKHCLKIIKAQPLEEPQATEEGSQKDGLMKG